MSHFKFQPVKHALKHMEICCITANSKIDIMVFDDPFRYFYQEIF
jgi:hypothetical protein